MEMAIWLGDGADISTLSQTYAIKRKINSTLLLQFSKSVVRKKFPLRVLQLIEGLKIALKLL